MSTLTAHHAGPRCSSNFPRAYLHLCSPDSSCRCTQRFLRRNRPKCLPVWAEALPLLITTNLRTLHLQNALGWWLSEEYNNSQQFARMSTNTHTVYIYMQCTYYACTYFAGFSLPEREFCCTGVQTNSRSRRPGDLMTKKNKTKQSGRQNQKNRKKNTANSRKPRSKIYAHLLAPFTLRSGTGFS